MLSHCCGPLRSWGRSVIVRCNTDCADLQLLDLEATIIDFMDRNPNLIGIKPYDGTIELDVTIN